MDEDFTEDSEIDNTSCSSSSTVQNSDPEDSELLEDPSGSYQPYAYEPLAESSDENEQDEVDIDGIFLQDIQDRCEKIQTLDQWCCCGHCNTDLLCSPREQWRSQPDSSVPLCKFPSYYHYSFLYKLIVFTVSEF